MKILIVKTSALGDIVHAFPALEYLRNKFPDASIDWVVERPFANVVKSHSYVNQVISADTRSWRKTWWKRQTWNEIQAFITQLCSTTYDIVFDLQGNTKSGLITGCARAKQKIGFAYESTAEWTNLLFIDACYPVSKGNNRRADYLSLVQQHFHDSSPFEPLSPPFTIASEEKLLVQEILNRLEIQITPRVMVCPGSAWTNKQVSYEALEEFLVLLHEHLKCSFLFLSGTEKEKLYGEHLSSRWRANSTTVNQLPFSALQHLMSNVDLIIAMDSFPLHLAGTTPTATFSIFGPSSANKYKPMGPQHRYLQGTCPYGKKFDKRCPILRTCKTGACIKELTGEGIFHAFINREEKGSGVGTDRSCR